MEITIAVDEIQAKWKHLRDHFYREIKLINSGGAHKKRKYVYFDDMEFMRDFVGYKMPPASNSKSKYNDALDGDNSSSYMEDNDTDEVMEELLKANDNAEDENCETPEPRRNLRRSVKPTPKMQAQKTTPASPPKHSKTHKEVIKNFDGLKKPNGQNAGVATSSGGAASAPSFRIRDGDISFCLSLVPTFRKLNESAKLRAKIETLKILHKFVEHAEKNKNATTAETRAPAGTNLSHEDEDHDMQEDHLDELDDSIKVKHEEADDPLHGSSGNTKAWWT